MGVISCHSRQASLIPFIYLVRVISTTNCYGSIILEQRTGGARRTSPEIEKACWRYNGSKAMPLASFGDLQQHEKVGNGQGKQTIPPARPPIVVLDTPTTKSFCLFAWRVILSEQLLSASSCRVDCH